MVDVDIECFAPKQDYKILVRCFTYNHAEYITDTLNGFTIQQTDFPFVCIVMDDCSTDGEQGVIKSYLSDNFYIEKSEQYETDNVSIIIANHKTNINCTLAVYFLKYNHYSKKKLKGSYLLKWRECCEYEALCEGDDYWTDPLKLQKQVDFLDCHPDFSMCFHSAEILNESRTREMIKCRTIENKEYFTNDIFPGWLIPTASIVCRRKMVESFPPLKHSEWMKYGDITLFLKCTHTGRVWGMSDAMSVYRMTEHGAVISQKNEKDYYDRMCRHYLFLMENFPQLDKTWPRNFIATWYYTKFRQTKGLKNLGVAFRNAPFYVIKKLLGIKANGTY